MRKFSSFLILSMGLLVAVGCTDARLKAASVFSGLVNGSTFATVKPPENAIGQLRVVFFVDQSYSMIHGKCPSDLDGSAPRKSSTGCMNPPIGIDPEGNRWKVVKKWIDELNATSPTSKVAIVPFSGGMNERPRKFPYNNTPIADGFEHYRFVNLNQAQARVNDLVMEQTTDLAKDTVIDNNNFVGSATTYMGTTVPLPTLLFARDKIFEEMEALQKAGQLFNTRFRFVYLSDGVFKPTDELLDKAMEMNSGRCSKKCFVDPRVVTCGNGWVSVDGKGWGSLTPEEKAKFPVECGYVSSNGFVENCFCLNIGNDLYQAMGDPASNRLERILSVLEEIKGLPKYFGEGTLRMDFVRIHPDRIATEDEQDIFGQMQKFHGDSAMSELVDDTPPFPIVGSTPSQLTYQLDAFYVVNLNALVTEMGELVVDSDGDGLGDAEERRIGTNPLDPRTPDAEGKRWCLDSIQKKYGCRKTSCSPDLDSDGDGLNECEEFTLQTSSFKKDNGSDSVLDYLKSTRGFRPAADLRITDSNGDGVSDFEAFRMGLHPLVRASSVSDDAKTKIHVRFLKYVQGRDGNGRPVQTGQYEINVEQVPLVTTEAISQGSETYRSRNRTPAARIPNELLVGSAAHGRRTNEILLIAKVQALQDPTKSYYLISRKNVLASQSRLNITVDFGQFRQMVGN